MSKTKPVLREEQALRLVVEGTVSETGTEFFRALVKNLAEVMGTVGAWVTEYLPEQKRLRAYAFWIKGGFVEHFEYDIAGTACEPVVEDKKLVHIPDRLLELYPGDPDIRALNAVSYLGVPLLDTAGDVIGHLSVLHDKPLPAEPRLVSLFEIFAARASAECRRLKVEEQVRAREEQLDALLRGAMDAILVLDESFCVVRVNPAAEKLFGFEAKALTGARLRDLLDNESASRLPALMRELDQRPEGARQLWIPQHLGAVRADGTTFPAEATLSGFAIHGKNFHALIMRSVNERIEAEKRIRLLLDEAEYLRESAGIGEMLGQSAPMKELFTSLKRVAATDATVLVLGETGTGKELIASSIHTASARREKPLVRVNCAAIPGSLMESEFFGHERGAFTGATAKREGRFALADGGTISLDEVGELPLDLQAKLLRVLQEGEFEPLGSTRTRRVNVRVVAATNRDLGEMARDGKFREDLFYRLNVFPLRVPPLREHGADVAVLARAFVERFARRMGRRIEPLHPDDVRRLQGYSWPGNVRELQNVIERAIILSPGSRLELHRAMPERSVAPAPPSGSATEVQILSAQEMESLERSNIERALAACGGKISGDSGAASRLGIAPSTLSSRMKALGIQRKGCPRDSASSVASFRESRNPATPAGRARFFQISDSQGSPRIGRTWHAASKWCQLSAGHHGVKQQKRPMSHPTMKKHIALLTISLSLIAAPTRADETCSSPYLARIEGQEEFLYVWTLGVDGLGDGSDKLVTVDVKPGSPDYGKVIHSHSLGGQHEAHHGGFTDDRRQLWLSGLESSKIFIFDVHTNPARPQYVKTIGDFAQTTGGAVGPHGVYALPGRVLIPCLSNAKDKGGRTALVEYSNDGDFIATHWLPTKETAGVAGAEFADGYGYDARVLPRKNALLTTSFTGLNNYMRAFGDMVKDAEAMKQFGGTMVMWDFHTRKPKKVFSVPGAPLEIRWAWGEKHNYAITATALTSKLWLCYEDGKGEWQAKEVGSIGGAGGVLPVDISLSADDRTLFVSCFGDGKCRVFDVSDPHQPKQIYEKEIGRQLNMVSQSWDGKRLYFSSSLLARWDKGN